MEQGSSSILPFAGGPKSKKNLKFRFLLNSKIDEGYSFDKAWKETLAELQPTLQGPFKNKILNARYQMNVNKRIIRYAQTRGKEPKGKDLKKIKKDVRELIESSEVKKYYAQYPSTTSLWSYVIPRLSMSY